MAKTKEEKKIYFRNWMNAHPNYYKEKIKPYIDKNRDTVNEYQKKYRQKDRTTLNGKIRQLYDNYVRLDKIYNRGECTLSKDWIRENLTECYYCGCTDKMQLGFDRIDNTLPHTPDNVVCCCGRCNTKRGSMPFEDFIKEKKITK